MSRALAGAGICLLAGIALLLMGGTLAAGMVTGVDEAWTEVLGTVVALAGFVALAAAVRISRPARRAFAASVDPAPSFTSWHMLLLVPPRFLIPIAIFVLLVGILWFADI